MEMSCIILPRKSGFNPLITLEKIIIFPATKPKKGDAKFGKKIFFEDGSWFMLWIVGEGEYYYVASSNHPITKYDLNDKIILLIHLFYCVMEYNGGLGHGTWEHFMVNQLLFGIKEYVGSHSENIYFYSRVDSIVNVFFNQFDMNVKINPMVVSTLKAKVSMTRYEQIQLREKSRQELKDFSDKFLELSGMIGKVLKSERDVGDACVQVGVDVMERGMQVDVERREYGLQVGLDEGRMGELRSLRKEREKMKREEEDKIVMTMDEYAGMMKMHKEEMEKAYNDGLERYKVNFMAFVRTQQLDNEQLGKMFSVQSTTVMVEVMQVWIMRWVMGAYRMTFAGMTMREMLKERKDVLCFVDFWKKVVMVNIGKLKHPIFRLMLKEWVDMVRAMQKTEKRVDEEMLDVCFNHFAVNFMGDSYYEKSIVPVFFNLLFSECRNIPIFLGIVNFYQINLKHLTEKDKENMLRDFELLYVVDKPLTILKSNRDNLQIGSEVSRIFFELS